VALPLTGIDGASFAVSAGCLAAMRNIPTVKATSSRILEGMAEGLRCCYSQRWLACSIVAVGIANLVSFYPFFILEPLLVRNVFHSGAFALGILFAANGAGGLLASLVTARRGTPGTSGDDHLDRVGGRGRLRRGGGYFSLAMGIGHLRRPGMGLVNYRNILWFPLVQHQTPAELLFRVSSVDWLFSLALSPLGAIAAGAAVTAVGVRVTLIAGGVMAAATGSVLLVPGVRAPDMRE
jgi:hypothetical protein